MRIRFAKYGLLIALCVHVSYRLDWKFICVFQITQEILDSRGDVDKANFGIIMTRARFDGQQFVDSYLFGRSLAMA